MFLLENARQLYRARRTCRVFFTRALSVTCFYILMFWSVGLFVTSGATEARVRLDAGSIKGTVWATTAAIRANTRPTLVPGAKLTLVNRDLPSQVLKTTTDDAGSFIFINLPAAVYVLTVEAGGVPSVTREVQLTFGATLVVEIELTATVAENVTCSASSRGR